MYIIFAQCGGLRNLIMLQMGVERWWDKCEKRVEGWTIPPFKVSPPRYMYLCDFRFIESSHRVIPCYVRWQRKLKGGIDIGRFSRYRALSRSCGPTCLVNSAGFLLVCGTCVCLCCYSVSMTVLSVWGEEIFHLF